MPTLHRPSTLDEACRLMADLDDAQVYGGGTAIQILRKQGVLFTEHLVDVGRIPELRDLTVTAAGVTVGAMVPVRRMERDATVLGSIPLASHTYAHVANPRVRNTASVGGNLAHGDYRLDGPTALLVLDAVVHITSVRGLREVPIRQFFTGFQETALEYDEIITAVYIPTQQDNAVGQFSKQTSLGLNDWPSASAAALITIHGDHRQIGLGLGALAEVPVYLSVDVTGMRRERAIAEAAAAAESAMDPIPDIRGSSSYKRQLGLVAVREAISDAWERSDVA